MDIQTYYKGRYPNETINGESVWKQLKPIGFGRLRQALKDGEGVYNTIGVCDSIVRETIFEGLAERLGVKYKVVYELWLNNTK